MYVFLYLSIILLFLLLIMDVHRPYLFDIFHPRVLNSNLTPTLSSMCRRYHQNFAEILERAALCCVATIPYSSSTPGVTGAGLLNSRSVPEAVLGNAITSRMDCV